jgi:hypothetical protein
MAELPPELDALGDALTRAVAVRRRRTDRRRRLVACVTAGLLVFAVSTPGRLGSAQQGGVLQQLAAVPALGIGGMGCDRPHGDGAQLPEGCGADAPQPQAAR